MRNTTIYDTPNIRRPVPSNRVPQILALFVVLGVMTHVLPLEIIVARCENGIYMRVLKGQGEFTKWSIHRVYVAFAVAGEPDQAGRHD